MSHTASFVSLSVLALVVGPVLYALSRKRTGALALLDGFVMASVGGLVVLHILPEAYEVAGLWTIAFAVAGLFAPLAVERVAHSAGREGHTAVVVVALLGLLLHTAMDGIVLAGGGHGGHQHGDSMSWAVVLHRLPMGLAIWWVVRSTWSRRISMAVLGLAMVGTVLGYSLGGPALAGLADRAPFQLLQAFVAGSLLHVLVHRPHFNRTPWTRYLELGGLLLGAAVVLGLNEQRAHGPELAAWGDTFLGLALESAPALLLGYALAGVFAVFLPRGTVRWVGRGSSFVQASKGTLFGIPIPICSCGVVPVYESLVKRGVPASAGMAFLVATPELGVESLILSLPLLGAELTGARLAAALIVALLVGVIVGRMVPKTEAASDEDSNGVDERSLKEKLRAMFDFGFREVVDDTAPWILVGIAVAALFGPGFAGSGFDLPTGVDILLFGLIGIPVYVCASGATPIAAAMIYVGVSPGAAITFLLAGPATNVTTFGILSRLHGRKVALVFGAVVFGIAVALGFAINAIIPASALPTGLAEHHEAVKGLQWVCLSILAVVFVWSLLRKGPTSFIGEVLEFGGLGGEDGHTHDHDHGHEHAHAHAHGSQSLEGTEQDHAHDHGHDHKPSTDSTSSSCGSSSCCSPDII